MEGDEIPSLLKIWNESFEISFPFLKFGRFKNRKINLPLPYCQRNKKQFVYDGRLLFSYTESRRRRRKWNSRSGAAAKTRWQMFLSYL